VRLEQPLERAFAALVDPGGAALIGVITRAADEAGSYEAVDAGALQSLAAGGPSPVALERFAREFFSEQPAGRLIAFEEAVAGGDWRAAIPLGTELLNLGWSYRDAVSAPLAEAYLQGARAEPATALTLLDEADAALGQSAARLRERALVLQANGQTLRALRALAGAARLDPLLRAELRTQVLAVSSQAALPVETRAAALAAAIAADPAYAPFHAALGHLYHAQGRYAEAVASLEQAGALDPALAAGIAAALVSARQRLRTPGETVAPLHASDGGLYLYVNVAGQRLRFVLDTGATYTALSAEAARRLGLDAFPDARRVALATAGGRVSAPLVTLGAIDVSGALVQQVPVVILDSTAPFDGLLGMSFLDHFDVDIDRRAGHVRLVRR
jgi:aspartyl protease family protein